MFVFQKRFYCIQINFLQNHWFLVLFQILFLSWHDKIQVLPLLSYLVEIWFLGIILMIYFHNNFIPNETFLPSRSVAFRFILNYALFCISKFSNFELSNLQANCKTVSPSLFLALRLILNSLDFSMIISGIKTSFL